jgi:glycosyltransferase involved in cell wall biosynthesis
MTVLHVAETVKGGVATMMREMLLDQADRIGAGSVCALLPKEQLGEMGELRNRVRVFKRSGRNVVSMFRFCLAFCAAVVLEKPKVVHLHSTFAGAIGRVLLFVLRPLRKPKVVYSPHGFSFLIDCQAWKKQAFTAIERALAPLGDKIVCVSNFERQSARLAGLPDDRLVVVHNGISDVEMLPRTSDETRVRLLFVGRLDRQKGFDILVQAFRLLDPAHYSLTVVGSAVNDAGPDTISLDQIEMVGWVSADKLPEYFARADLVVMPSRWEGFGLVAIEAQLHEVPVVAANNTSLPEVVEDGVTGFLCDSGSSTALAQAICVAASSDLRSMGRAGRGRVRENFLATAMCNKVAELYCY